MREREAQKTSNFSFGSYPLKEVFCGDCGFVAYDFESKSAWIGICQANFAMTNFFGRQLFGVDTVFD